MKESEDSMEKNERELQGLITQVDDELDEEKEHHKKTMETLKKTEEELENLVGIWVKFMSWSSNPSLMSFHMTVAAPNHKSVRRNTY